MADCLESANAILGNLEGAHRVHGWPVPLRVTNVSFGGVQAQLATLAGIGEPHPYVHDAVSSSLMTTGGGEILDPQEIATAANRAAPLPSEGTFLDVGAQLGFYSFAFAKRGYRVIAIEPMLHHTLAMEASRCLNMPWAGRITILHTAALRPAQLSGSCAVMSPWKSNNHGDGKLECTRTRGASQCQRRHNGQIISSNFTYFFHYRRFCQQILSPLRTLDALLLDSETQLSSVDVAKVDTAGSECDVLAGANRSLFQLLRPTLILVNIESPVSEACVRELAQTHGYSVHAFDVAMTPMPVARGMNGKHVVLADSAARTENKL